MRENTFFAYMAASTHHVIKKEEENQILRYNWIFRHVCINNPHWQRWNYNYLVQLLYIVISGTLVGFFLDVLISLLAIILSELCEKPRRNKDWVKKKVHWRFCVKHITFLNARSPFYVNFCCFLRLLPFLSDALAEWSQ